MEEPQRSEISLEVMANGAAEPQSRTVPELGPSRLRSRFLSESPKKLHKNYTMGAGQFLTGEDTSDLFFRHRSTSLDIANQGIGTFGVSPEESCRYLLRLRSGEKGYNSDAGPSIRDLKWAVGGRVSNILVKGTTPIGSATPTVATRRVFNVPDLFAKKDSMNRNIPLSNWATVSDVVAPAFDVVTHDDLKSEQRIPDVVSPQLRQTASPLESVAELPEDLGLSSIDTSITSLEDTHQFATNAAGSGTILNGTLLVSPTIRRILLLEKLTRWEAVTRELDDHNEVRRLQLQFPGMYETHLAHKAAFRFIVDRFTDLHQVSLKIVQAQQRQRVSLKGIDAVVSAGGDGTFLEAASLVSWTPIPCQIMRAEYRDCDLISPLLKSSNTRSCGTVPTARVTEDPGNTVDDQSTEAASKEGCNRSKPPQNSSDNPLEQSAQCSTDCETSRRKESAMSISRERNSGRSSSGSRGSATEKIASGAANEFGNLLLETTCFDPGFSHVMPIWVFGVNTDPRRSEGNLLLHDKSVMEDYESPSSGRVPPERIPVVCEPLNPELGGLGATCSRRLASDSDAAIDDSSSTVSDDDSGELPLAIRASLASAVDRIASSTFVPLCRRRIRVTIIEAAFNDAGQAPGEVRRPIRGQEDHREGDIREAVVGEAKPSDSAEWKRPTRTWSATYRRFRTPTTTASAGKPQTSKSFAGRSLQVPAVGKSVSQPVTPQRHRVESSHRSAPGARNERHVPYSCVEAAEDCSSTSGKETLGSDSDDSDGSLFNNQMTNKSRRLKRTKVALNASPFIGGSSQCLATGKRRGRNQMVNNASKDSLYWTPPFRNVEQQEKESATANGSGSSNAEHVEPKPSEHVETEEKWICSTNETGGRCIKEEFAKAADNVNIPTSAPETARSLSARSSGKRSSIDRVAQNTLLAARSRVLSYRAVNDVFITCCASQHALYVDLQIGTDPPIRSKNSGVIVCTGTGSSAWAYNASKVSSDVVSQIIEAFKATQSADARKNLSTPNIDELCQKVNSSLLFDPGDAQMRFVIRDPISNRVFATQKRSGYCTRMLITPLSPDVCVSLDGLSVVPIKFGQKILLEIGHDEDTLLTGF